MKFGLEREKYLSGLLALMVLILGGVLVWEWDQGMQLKQDLSRFLKIPITTLPEQRVLPEFALPDKATGLPEWLSRPIFSPIRRPPAAKVGVATMKKGQFLLVGVLITPQQRAALLRDVQTNKTETVIMGSMVRGLTLGEVGPEQVTLRQGGDSEDLALNVQTGPKGPSVQRKPVATPPPMAAASQAAPVSSAASAPVKQTAAAAAPKMPTSPADAKK